MITLRQLRYFDALVRHQHFGKAADAVSVSQPALSMQIKELEDSLGIALIERTSRGIHLTAEGEEIARRAKTILSSVEDLTDYAIHSADPLNGPLRLGVIPSIAPYLLPKVLPRLQSEFPGLELQLHETQTLRLLDELDHGVLDLLLLALPIDNSDIETLELFTDRFLLAVSAKADCLDKKNNASAPNADEIVRKERLLLLEEGHCLRDQALNYCTAAESDLLNRYGATSLSTIMQMVSNGFGVTLLPEMCVGIEGQGDKVKLIKFKAPEPARTIGLAWRKSSPRGNDYKVLAKIFTEAAEKRPS